MALGVDAASVLLPSTVMAASTVLGAGGAEAGVWIDWASTVTVGCEVWTVGDGGNGVGVGAAATR